VSALRFSCVLLAAALLSGCASDRYLASRSHKIFADRDYAKAAEAYAGDAAKPGVNQFLFLVDAGTSYFAAHEYARAIAEFLQAEKLAEVKDYTSISEETGTLVTSDNVRTYKGEDFEKVLVNVYLALSYASLGNIEDAQVEARKINLLLYRMINEGKRNYKESPFARYLSAMLWEASGETNDAYVDYKNTYKLDPKFPDIGSDLLATSRKMRFFDEARDWANKFPTAKAREIGKDQGEVVVLFERGFGPIKVPRDGENSSLPIFIRRFSQVDHGRVKVDGQYVGDTKVVLDVETTSIRYLEDRIGRMIAKKVAGTVAKGAVAVGVGKLTHNKDLGWLAFYILQATDRADLRSWQTLPADMEMIRVPLKAGKHHVEIEAIGRSGEVIFARDLGEVELRPGSKAFLTAR
jgi:hypothetical protein